MSDLCTYPLACRHPFVGIPAILNGQAFPFAGSTLADSDGYFHQRTGVEHSYRQANGPTTSPASPTRSSASAESGMIVFSSPTHILHMNGQARSLMALFSESRDCWVLPTHESMPSILTEFCHAVLEELRGRIDAHDWAQFEIRRVCHMVTPPLLLRGFGVPDSARQQPRVILTLQSLVPSEHSSAIEDTLDTVPQPTASFSRADS